MAGYRPGSGWNELNELRCLYALKILQEKGSPRGLMLKLAEEIAEQSGLKAGSVRAKISNYKSVAGARPSNASTQTIATYERYGQLDSSEIRELIDRKMGLHESK